jgi:hypothetical protein
LCVVTLSYFFFFCRTVFSAGNATGKLFHFDTKTCDLLEEISLGEGQINVLKYSPKVWQYQMWSFKFGDKVQIYWDRPQILKKSKSLESTLDRFFFLNGKTNICRALNKCRAWAKYAKIYWE